MFRRHLGHLQGALRQNLKLTKKNALQSYLHCITASVCIKFAFVGVTNECFR